MNHSKQHTLWLLAAMAAPIAHFSGALWLTGALTALAVLPLTLLPRSWDLPKPVAILQILWLGIVAGILLPGSTAYWPSDNTWVVPLTIVILAAFTAKASAPRVGAVLALCMTLLAIPIMIAAASRLETSWLAPVIRPWSPGLTISLLIPTLPACGTEQQGRRLFGLGVLTIVLCALVQGVTGSIHAEDPFYQTARTLGHMEPVVASGLTLGWYCLACLICRSARAIAHCAGICPKWAGVLVWGTTTIIILFQQQPNVWFVTAISIILWVITPLANKIKDFEKR